jgi:uncharacterized protein YkwD
MKIVYFVILALLLSVNGCATKQDGIGNSNTNNTSMSTESRMVQYVNSIRQKGATCAPPAPPLRLNSALEAAAAAHAKDMALNNTLSHTGSGTATDPAKSALGAGSTHIDRILYFGFPNKPGRLLGEDLTYSKFSISKSKDYFVNFKKAMTNLMNDRVHCESIMNPRFTDVGMAMYKSDDRYYFAMTLGEIK